MNISASSIERIAQILAANEGYDSWPCKVTKLVVETGGQRITLSRKTKWAPLVVSRIDEVRR